MVLEQSFSHWLSEAGIDGAEEILALARIVEAHHGNLDAAWDQDRLKRLLWMLTYTSEDQQRWGEPRHIIPMDGDAYVATRAYWSCVRLYAWFRAALETPESFDVLAARMPHLAQVTEEITPEDAAAEVEGRYEKYLMALLELTREGSWEEWKTRELDHLREELSIPDDLHVFLVSRHLPLAKRHDISLDVDLDGFSEARRGCPTVLALRVRNVGTRALRNIVMRHAVVGAGEVHAHTVHLVGPGQSDFRVHAISCEQAGRYALELVVSAEDMLGTPQHFRAQPLVFDVSDSCGDAEVANAPKSGRAGGHDRCSWQEMPLYLIPVEEAELWVLARDKPGRERIVVDAHGRGDTRSIGVALAHAHTGMTIVVRAGCYHEEIELSRTVHLVAEGEVTIVSQTGPCMTVTAGDPTIRGFRLERVADPYEVDVAVDIQGGRPLFERCKVISAGREAIALLAWAADAFMDPRQVLPRSRDFIAVRKAHPATPEFRSCTVNGRDFRG